jgi:hypothetical protein
MNRHASINRVYRLIWSQALGAFVAVAETTRGAGKGSHRAARRVSKRSVHLDHRERRLAPS